MSYDLCSIVLYASHYTILQRHTGGLHFTTGIDQFSERVALPIACRIYVGTESNTPEYSAIE